jgi:hypothetical protein
MTTVYRMDIAIHVAEGTQL